MNATKDKDRVMISQPMRGKTEQEIAETRERATAELTKRGYEIVNTRYADSPYDPVAEKTCKQCGIKNVPLFYMGHSISEMSRCNAVYFCKGWEDTRGCKIEHEAAKAYGLDIIYE